MYTTSLTYYANIALDINIKDLSNRLFTYEIPEHLKQDVFVGSQVLVPFGNHELVSGLVISLHTNTENISTSDNNVQEKNSSAVLTQVRTISEVIDSSIFNNNYINFLYWIADYYICGLADVLQAAIPADIGLKVKRVISLKNKEKLEHFFSNKKNNLLTEHSQKESLSDEQLLLDILLQAKKELSFKSIKGKSQLPNKNFYAALAKLRQQGMIEVLRQSETPVGPKFVTQVLLASGEAKNKRQEEIISFLRQNNGTCLQSKLIKQCGTTNATIKKMAMDGTVSLQTVEFIRDPLIAIDRHMKQSKPSYELTDDQKESFTKLSAELTKKLTTTSDSVQETISPWLLFGVTGSGKTEIYIRLIEETLKTGRSAILLVPEIGLTPQLASRLACRFHDQLAIWHSGLSQGERFDTWRRLQEGQLKVLVGTRSAILVNMPELGLIILDEEHDSSYKQNSPNPRYNASTLALQRGKYEGAFVLFGSATPAISTYFAAQAANQVLKLPKRIFQDILPESIIVDMRQELAHNTQEIFSQTLINELACCLNNQEQSILLINRRGYASHIFCRACGYVIKCRNCSISLTFHTNQKDHVQQTDFTPDTVNRGYLMCHHCGYTQKANTICPSCTSPFLKDLGLGIQKVEKECCELFPQARVIRIDSDIAAKKGAWEEILGKFTRHEVDILIGTQLIAKGMDIANVTLVGVLAADAAFNLPDYRSCERGFQLLTQVSGRAGRGQRPGKVILQSFSPDLPTLLLAKNQDYQSFFAYELESRRLFDYPPFGQLIRVIISGVNINEVQTTSEYLAEEISNYLDNVSIPTQIKILGPTPCLLERIKGQYRYHILIKNLSGEVGHLTLRKFFQQKIYPQTVRVVIDVDPVDLI